MDYEFWFWIGVAVFLGRLSTRPIFYFGPDEEKYKKAWIAVLTQ